MATYQEFVEGGPEPTGTVTSDLSALGSAPAIRCRSSVGAARSSVPSTDPLTSRASWASSRPARSRTPASGPELLEELGRLVSRPPEQARYLLQAVVAQLRDQDAALVDELTGHLPPETRDALAEAGESPDRAVTTTPERPTELDGDEVAADLRKLEGWDGDEHGISRTVALPEDRIGPLVERVEREARRSGDHVRVGRETGAVTFTLRTREEAVTRPDLELAGRIDEVVGGFGSGG